MTFDSALEISDSHNINILQVHEQRPAVQGPSPGEVVAQGPTLEEAAPRAPVAQDPKAEGPVVQAPRAAGPVVQGLSPVAPAPDPFPVASVGQGRAVAPSSGEIQSLNDLDGAYHNPSLCWMMLDDPYLSLA